MTPAAAADAGVSDDYARARIREIEEKQAQLRAARLSERTKLARDLHDIVAHHVSAIVMRASAAQFAGATSKTADALADIRAAGARTMTELRRLLTDLRDPDTVDDPLSVDDPENVIQDAISQSSEAGLRVASSVDSAFDDTPTVIRATAARVVQEGLTNVLKHAGPGAVADVSVRVAAEAITITVDNDLSRRPPRPNRDPGYGLVGMRERVGILRGTLDAGPRNQGGWRLSAVIPMRG